MLLDTEFDYYRTHQDELVSRYNGKVLAIAEEDVVAVFETEKDAYFTMKEKYPVGTFLIQLCSPGEEAYTYSSRVRFD